MGAAACLAACSLYLIASLGDEVRAEFGAALDLTSRQSEVLDLFRSAIWTVLIVGALGTVVTLVAMVALAKTCLGSVASIAASLHRSAVLVMESSQMMSHSSESLANGASQQAASLEETSSSLEELASMTSKNASNASEVNHLTKQAREAAERGAKDMGAMSAAMAEIKSSSDEVSQIINTINEIAFQTNILALNAAVEAARAGASGAGFAVVADEVRSLAQRSAGAANETTTRIKSAISKTSQGVELTEKVMESLRVIVEINRKVDSLAGEVADASAQQSSGIEQLRTSVFEMDTVTQQNAASAEESASATRELGTQAQIVWGAVEELRGLLSARQREGGRLLVEGRGLGRSSDGASGSRMEGGKGFERRQESFAGFELDRA